MDNTKDTPQPLTLVTFGDSILACESYNSRSITPGQLVDLPIFCVAARNG